MTSRSLWRGTCTMGVMHYVRFFNSQQVLRLLLTCDGFQVVNKYKDLEIILGKWQRK